MKLNLLTEREVGVFWIEDDEIIAVTEPLDEVERVGRFSISKYNHDNVWMHVKDRFKDGEYFRHPRGRVSYDHKDRAFVILLPSKYVNDEKVINNVRRAFDITRYKYKIESDLHYEPKPPDYEWDDDFDDDFDDDSV